MTTQRYGEFGFKLADSCRLKTEEPLPRRRDRGLLLPQHGRYGRHRL